MCSSSEYHALYSQCMDELATQGWLDGDGQLVEPATQARALPYFNECALLRRRTMLGRALRRCAARHRRFLSFRRGRDRRRHGYWASLAGGVDAALPRCGADARRGGAQRLPCAARPGQRAPLFPVEAGGAARAADHPQRTLLLCWPPAETARVHQPQVATMALDALRHGRGDTVAYVGVRRAAEDGTAAGDGAAASDERSRAGTRRPLEAELTREFTLVETVALLRWPPIADSLTVWEAVRRGERRRQAAPRPPRAAAAAAAARCEGWHTHGEALLERRRAARGAARIGFAAAPTGGGSGASSRRAAAAARARAHAAAGARARACAAAVDGQHGLVGKGGRAATDSRRESL